MYSSFRVAQIARDVTPNGYLVSTVELADGTFETMVFAQTPNSKSFNWHELHCERTLSIETARDNHKTALHIFDNRKAVR